MSRLHRRFVALSCFHGFRALHSAALLLAPALPSRRCLRAYDARCAASWRVLGWGGGVLRITDQ